MDMQRYEARLENLKFGEVLQCDEKHCEICGLYLGEYITPSTPLNAVNGLRLCHEHASEEYKKNLTRICEP